MLRGSFKNLGSLNYDHWGLVRSTEASASLFAFIHGSSFSATERPEEFTGLVLDPVGPSVCPSDWITWRKVCVYTHTHRERETERPRDRERERDREASCSTTLAVLGHEAAWAMCPALPWQQRTARLTHTHGQNIFSLSLSLFCCFFSPHTHSRSSPAAERCNRNTEEPACLS